MPVPADLTHLPPWCAAKQSLNHFFLYPTDRRRDDLVTAAAAEAAEEPALPQKEPEVVTREISEEEAERLL